jgi:LemA protein
MNEGMILTLAIIAVIVLVVIFLIAAYNKLIVLKNEVDNAFASVDVQLKKRYDLIPNLVEVVKQYMTYERDILEKLVALREQALKATNFDEVLKLENEIFKTLNILQMRAEAYPELKASANFLQLQAALSEVEDSIAAARRFYNQAVTDYNSTIEQIPYNFFAQMLGFEKRPLFTISEEERQNMDLKQLFNRG